MERKTVKDCGTSLKPERKLTNDFLNVDFTAMHISQSKVDEIKQLLASIKYKIERCHIVELSVDAPALSSKIKSDLLGKYVLSDGSSAPNMDACVLFGLSEIETGSDEKQHSALQEKCFRKCITSKALFSDAVERFPPKLFCKKMDTLKAILSLNEEYISTMENLEELKNITLEVKDLLILKQKRCIEAANILWNVLIKLNFEARLLKYRSLLAFFTAANKRVVEASYILKDGILSEFEKLQEKESDLKVKMEVFKQLKGTNFDKLLSDYQAICKSISDKQWTLQNLE